MYFDLKARERNSEEESIRFLNSSARDFYLDKNEYSDTNFPIIFKANIMTGIVDFERTIRGTFSSDLHFDNISVRYFQICFLHAFKMFKITNYSELRSVGILLDRLRNINAHALNSERDKTFFDYDFTFLKDEPVLNQQIKYFDKEITVAGIIYILLNFLRKQSIETLINKDRIFSLVASGEYKWDDGKTFVSKISRTDLNGVGIRKTQGENVADSIFGDYKKHVNYSENGNFSIEIGDSNNHHPSLKASGKITKTTVKIDAHSLTRTYYNADYTLDIIDYAGFIELSNSLPSFAFVDYLYATGITCFTQETYLKLKDQWEMISKLNKPKFYIDKNIKILLLPETMSDFRLVSAILLDGLQKIFLLFENYIYKTKNIDTQGKESDIISALKELRASNTLILNAMCLRNMVAHGYILDEYFFFKDKCKIFSVDFIISTLEAMLHLVKSDAELYEYLGEAIKSNLLDTLVSAKYRQATKYAYDFFNTYPNYNEEEWAKKDGFIEHSMLNISLFEKLMTIDYEMCKVIRISSEDLPRKLYIFNTEKAKTSLTEFCDRQDYKLEKIKQEGLLFDYTIRKK